MTVVGNDQLSSVRVGFDCAGVTEIPPAECQALVDLYNQTHGPSWTVGTNWLQTQPCAWYGVACASGHVTELRLTNGLNGTIPDSLSNLSALRWLDLSNNQLSGGIPSSLSSLSNLRWLNLYSNALTGDTPLDAARRV